MKSAPKKPPAESICWSVKCRRATREVRVCTDTGDVAANVVSLRQAHCSEAKVTFERCLCDGGSDKGRIVSIAKDAH